MRASRPNKRRMRAALSLVAVVCFSWSVSAFSPPLSTRRGSRFSSLHYLSATTPTKQLEKQNDDNNMKKTVVIAGATGYIGRAVVQESVARGYRTVALVRDVSKLDTPTGQAAYKESFRGATVVECNVQDEKQVQSVISRYSPDSIISCLASPSGTKKDAYAIDYQASLNCLQAGQDVGSRHFVLLSAFCCRNPLLQLQQAKLKLEAEIQAQSDVTYSIVRPTAFFKSVSGQLEAIQSGAPYILFDDGAATRCNPIAESDLAKYMMNCLVDESKRNKILNVGGPDAPLTNKDLGEMMFRAIGKEPKFVYAPTAIFDPIISTIQFLATLTKSQALEDAAETGRIGKYYAVEDMLTTCPKEKYGTITMQDHYNTIAAKGQDPFTPVRATAVISRAIDGLPAFLCTAVPAAFAATHPTAVARSQLDVSMLLAELTSGKHM